MLYTYIVKSQFFLNNFTLDSLILLLYYVYILFLGLVFMHDPISCIALIIIVLK